MKRTLAAVLAGAVLAAMVACGGAKMTKSSSPRPVASMDGGAPPGMAHNPDIAAADAKIDEAMKKLEIPRPPPAVCAQPPCGADAMVRPTADPKCVRGESVACTDTCKLADLVCDNAETICKIAKQLNNDTWANEKCAGAETSCEAARKKCCGCS